MKKKSTWLVIVVVVVVIAAVGGYALFHKSPKKITVSTTYTAVGTSKPTSSSNIVQTESQSGIGQYLANSSGQALYTYSNDTSGVSNCTGSCISSWPIYSPTTSSASLPTNVSIITRSDGNKQYAYKGLPLYTFVGDSSGQVTGNGVSGFNVAKP